MRIQSLFEQKQLIIEHRAYSQKLLTESCEGLSPDQKRIVEGIHRELLPLIEASLSADQIQQLFGQVEKSATAAGSNRTAIGKGKDVAAKANEIINNVGKWLQDTAPVKAFDSKFDQLKSTIGTKFPDLDKNLTAMGTWAKENPGKTAAIIGVLTAIASIAGGPLGGAIAGQALRGATELLKGEKLSTAIGKGVKTAALGYLSGKAFELIGDFVGNMRADSIPFGPADAGLEKVSYGATQTLTAPGLKSVETIKGFNIVAFGDQADAVNNAMDMIKNGQAGGFDALKKVAREISSPEYKSAIKDIMANARDAQLSNDSLMQWIDGMAQAGQAMSQGAVAASTGSEKKESYYRQTRPLSEGQVYMMFNKIERLDEGPFDAIKAGAGKLAGAAAKKIGQVGTNLTTKVTADKLNSAWKAAGSPTDSNELAAFLEKQGVDSSVVTQVYADMKLSTTTDQPVAAPSSYKNAQELIKKLTKKDKQRLMTYVQKSLATS